MGHKMEKGPLSKKRKKKRKEKRNWFEFYFKSLTLLIQTTTDTVLLTVIIMSEIDCICLNYDKFQLENICGLGTFSIYCIYGMLLTLNKDLKWI